MRGISRRENAAFWAVKIFQNHDFSEVRTGTTFTSSFTKNRDDGGHREKSIDWSFVTADDRTDATWRPTDIKEFVYELIKNGVDSNADIAAELGITKGVVPIYVSKLIAENFVKKQGPATWSTEAENSCGKISFLFFKIEKVLQKHPHRGDSVKLFEELKLGSLYSCGLAVLFFANFRKLFLKRRNHF
jgi:hypothetical protein